MPQALLLASGGLESTAVAVLKRPSVLLFVDHGQPNKRQEAISVTALAEFLKAELIVRKITPALAVFPDGYVPARNWLLASLGTHEAVALGLREVWFGFMAPSPFPDTTQEWVNKVNAVLAAEGLPVKVAAPLLNAHPVEILKQLIRSCPQELIREALKASCLKAKDYPCTKRSPCPKCAERLTWLHLASRLNREIG